MFDEPKDFSKTYMATVGTQFFRFAQLYNYLFAFEIVLSTLRLTASDGPFGIFKLDMVLSYA
jgi:hypothetical protein